MTVAVQSKKRIKVPFPRPVFDLLVTDVPPGKRSAFIVAAIEEALQRKLLQLDEDPLEPARQGRNPGTKMSNEIRLRLQP